MRYLSICSGIEAASIAWEPLGWQPLAFAEIEPFPAAVLAHRSRKSLALRFFWWHKRLSGSREFPR